MSEWLKSQWKPGSPHIASTGGGGTPWCGYGCGADGYDVDYTAECPGPKPKSQPVPPRTPEGLTAEQVQALQLENAVLRRNVQGHQSELESLRAALTQRTEERDDALNNAELYRASAQTAFRDLQAEIECRAANQDAARRNHERAEVAEAELAQAREQRDAVLRDVAKLSNPWRPDLSGFQFCDWCDVKVEMPYYEDKATMECGYRTIPHPDNDCLWPRALAASEPADVHRTPRLYQHKRHVKVEAVRLLDGRWRVKRLDAARASYLSDEQFRAAYDPAPMPSAAHPYTEYLAEDAIDAAAASGRGSAPQGDSK